VTCETKSNYFPVLYLCYGVAGEEWSRLLALSPLFHLMKEVEQQLRDSARDRGLLKIQPLGQALIITTETCKVISVATDDLKP